MVTLVTLEAGVSRTTTYNTTLLLCWQHITIEWRWVASLYSPSLSHLLVSPSLQDVYTLSFEHPPPAPTTLPNLFCPLHWFHLLHPSSASVIFLHPPRGGKYPPPNWETTPPQLSVIFSVFLMFFNVNLHFRMFTPPKHLSIPPNFKFLEITLLSIYSTFVNRLNSS